MNNKTQALILAGTAGIAALAFFMKPSKSDFITHMQNEMKKEGFFGAVGSVFVPLALNENTMSFSDYLVFAFVEIPPLSNSDTKCYYVGLFGKWFRVI